MSEPAILGRLDVSDLEPYIDKDDDHIFLEKGAETSWEVTSPLREYFVAFNAR